MFVSTGSVWYLRTKDMNFFPEGEEGDGSVLQVRSPIVGPPRPSLIRIPKGAVPLAAQNLNGFKSLRFDEESALQTFAKYKQKGSMEAAYLVGERILENAQLSLNDKSDIAEEMSSYLSTLRPCVLDVYTETPVKLVLVGLDLKKEQKKVLALQLQAIIKRSSGGLAKCLVDFESGDSPQAKFQMNEEEFVGEISDSIEINDLVASLYQILHKQNALLGNDLALPSWNKPTISQLETGITRFAWSLLLSPKGEKKPEVEAP